MKKFFEKYLTQLGNAIRIIGIPEGEERKKGAGSLFKEIIAENFPNLGKELDLQVHEATVTLNYINAKRPSPRHIIIKLSKVNVKEKNIKGSKRKENNLQRNLHQAFSGFLSRIFTG